MSEQQVKPGGADAARSSESPPQVAPATGGRTRRFGRRIDCTGPAAAETGAKVGGPVPPAKLGEAEHEGGRRRKG